MPLNEVQSTYVLLLLFDRPEGDLSRSVRSLELPWVAGSRRPAAFDSQRSVLELVPTSDNQPSECAIHGALLHLTDPNNGKRRVLFLGVRS